MAQTQRRVALLLACLLMAAPAAGAAPPERCAHPPAPQDLIRGRVTRVTDGDTLTAGLADGQRVQVRLLGIDAPEVFEGSKLRRDVRRSGLPPATIQAMGRLAREFAREHLHDQPIGLELDVRTRDIYGRLLAYVWLPDALFNVLIVREGYARTMVIAPNSRYAGLLRACEQEAREQRRGLWGW